MAAGIYNEPEKPNDGDNPVKIVISAGTPLAIWEGFEKRFNVQILEWYAAVEGGFAYKPLGQGPVGSFGKPIPGVMEFKIVNENDEPVPVGQTGNSFPHDQGRYESGLPGTARGVPRQDQGRLAEIGRYGPQGRKRLVLL